MLRPPSGTLAQHIIIYPTLGQSVMCAGMDQFILTHSQRTGGPCKIASPIGDRPHTIL